MRYSPPVGVAGRQAAADIELHGVTIPAGAKITCLIGAANRDPHKFADLTASTSLGPTTTRPRDFPERPTTWAFSTGDTFASVAQLARADVQIALN
jgi:cytochrome P450